MLRICVFFLPRRLTAFILCVFNVFTLVLVNVVLTALLSRYLYCPLLCVSWRRGLVEIPRSLESGDPPLGS